jgi:NAD(P)-dependent dehydrogenase (short-subunit alcohol dehydrogenase family)
VHVLLTSRDEAKGQTARDQLAAQGLQVSYHPLDVTQPASVGQLKHDVQRLYGRCDILVNNAAVYIDTKHSLLDADLDALRLSIETNAIGPLVLTQAFMPMMRRHGYGRVVNVSSGIGEMKNLDSTWPAYRLSKILLNLQTRILAQELAGTNILINAMCPGWVRTEMGGQAAPRSVEQGADTAVWLALLPEGGPQGGFFRDRKPIDW